MDFTAFLGEVDMSGLCKAARNVRNAQTKVVSAVNGRKGEVRMLESRPAQT